MNAGFDRPQRPEVLPRRTSTSPIATRSSQAAGVAGSPSSSASTPTSSTSKAPKAAAQTSSPPNFTSSTSSNRGEGPCIDCASDGHPLSPMVQSKMNQSKASSSTAASTSASARQSLPIISTKGWTLEGILAQSKNFKEVPRYNARRSLSDVKARVDEFDNDTAGVPLVIENWDKKTAWPTTTFSPEWLLHNHPQRGELIHVRNVHDRSESVVSLREFLEWTEDASVYALPGDKRRWYWKDAVCPKEWQIWVEQQGIIPGSLLQHGEADYMKFLPKNDRVETLMCYLGVGDTFTPCHKDLCASSGQNLMCYADPNSSSFWFMTASSDSPAVSTYFHSLAKEIDSEAHVLTLDELAKAPFTVYVTEQKVGDLVLVPPRSCHQVVNNGRLTIKTSWSRMTLAGLETALYHELPIYRRICRPETYRIKATIYASLTRLFLLHDQFSSTAPSKATSILDPLRKLLEMTDNILEEECLTEHGSLPLIGSGDGSDHYTCDYCSGDIFASLYECRQCVEASDGDGTHICPGCYIEGRSCKCGNMEPIRCRDFDQLLSRRNEARALLKRVSNEDILIHMTEELLTSDNRSENKRLVLFEAGATILLFDRLEHSNERRCSADSPHNAKSYAVVPCKQGCHRSLCYAHFLYRHGMHSAEIILEKRPLMDEIQWHRMHQIRKKYAADRESAAKEAERKGTFFEPRIRLMMYAKRYHGYPPANGALLSKGWYDTTEFVPEEDEVVVEGKPSANVHNSSEPASSSSPPADSRTTDDEGEVEKAIAFLSSPSPPSPAHTSPPSQKAPSEDVEPENEDEATVDDREVFVLSPRAVFPSSIFSDSPLSSAAPTPRLLSPAPSEVAPTAVASTSTSRKKGASAVASVASTSTSQAERPPAKRSVAAREFYIEIPVLKAKQKQAYASVSSVGKGKGRQVPTAKSSTRFTKTAPAPATDNVSDSSSPQQVVIVRRRVPQLEKSEVVQRQRAQPVNAASKARQGNEPVSRKGVTSAKVPTATTSTTTGRPAAKKRKISTRIIDDSEEEATSDDDDLPLPSSSMKRSPISRLRKRAPVDRDGSPSKRFRVLSPKPIEDGSEVDDEEPSASRPSVPTARSNQQPNRDRPGQGTKKRAVQEATSPARKPTETVPATTAPVENGDDQSPGNRGSSAAVRGRSSPLIVRLNKRPLRTADNSTKKRARLGTGVSPSGRTDTAPVYEELASAYNSLEPHSHQPPSVSSDPSKRGRGPKKTQPQPVTTSTAPLPRAGTSSGQLQANSTTQPAPPKSTDDPAALHAKIAQLEAEVVRLKSRQPMSLGDPSFFQLRDQVQRQGVQLNRQDEQLRLLHSGRKESPVVQIFANSVASQPGDPDGPVQIVQASGSWQAASNRQGQWRRRGGFDHTSGPYSGNPRASYMASRANGNSANGDGRGQRSGFNSASSHLPQTQMHQPQPQQPPRPQIPTPPTDRVDGRTSQPPTMSEGGITPRPGPSQPQQSAVPREQQGVSSSSSPSTWKKPAPQKPTFEREGSAESADTVALIHTLDRRADKGKSRKTPSRA